MSDPPLLSVRNLTKHYPVTEGLLRRETGRVRAVDGVSFDLRAGETLGVVGESGCGKSTLASTLLGLEEPTGGRVLYDGREVGALSGTERKRFRRESGAVFQDPGTSLDPRMTAGESIGEPLRIHGVTDRERRRRIAEDLCERVGLSAATVDRYPNELSGGQKQRVAIARALVTNPRLLVADEPTAALDAGVAAEVLSLLASLAAETGLATLLVSHDLSVVREVCDRVAVMYLGRIVELAPTEALFAAPEHPYTRALLAAMPAPDPRRRGEGEPLGGSVPDPADPPAGCRFHTRCSEVVRPEGVDLDPETWQAVLDLRVRLAGNGIDPAAMRRLVAAAGDKPASAVDDAAVAAAVRDEFGLPARLDDREAEAAVGRAIDAVVAGDDAVAAERLAAAFETPCVAEDPDRRATAPGRSVACHRHDPKVDVEGSAGDVADGNDGRGVTDVNDARGAADADGSR